MYVATIRKSRSKGFSFMPDFTPKTVLVIEDDTICLHSVRNVLRRAGHCVFTATTVAEAEEKWAMAHEDIDVILSDNRLENDRGLDLVARFKSQAPAVQVVLCSGEDFDLELPHSIFLQKPFTARALLDALGSNSSTGSGGQD